MEWGASAVMVLILEIVVFTIFCMWSIRCSGLTGAGDLGAIDKSRVFSIRGRFCGVGMLVCLFCALAKGDKI